MTDKVRLAVFVSGAGSNLQTLIDVSRAESDWPLQVCAVVSDRPDCGGVARARMAGLPVFAARPRDYPDKAAFEQAVVAYLQSQKIALIALAGYMRIVGGTLLAAYRDRIVNIHPSYLPAFPGAHAVADALAAGAAETGVTVHWVDEGVDTGPILLQEKVPIDPGMTAADLLTRVHAVEHRLYPRALALAAQTHSLKG